MRQYVPFEQGAWTDAARPPRFLAEDAGMRALFVKGIRAAHASSGTLIQAAGEWRRAARDPLLEQGFALLQGEAEEGLRRVEYVLADLGCDARAATCWISRNDLEAQERADDGALLAVSAWAVGRVVAGMVRVQVLAHECGEYQAARLQQMTTQGLLFSARRLFGAARMPRATSAHAFPQDA
ncbi:hypothetical protein J8J14_10845 [Roseomonas sp. SSH11]|uniref:Uncharacterized protein n=1 Tax=Pararoseomonas baculiformis TaxID=2820812 RepID=A0ABS4AE46_9PROT|nr:hypothetical protein [Pararoseomonas baculiformis]MBP0445275.1 hypothetical protein [Pararoseomonas baculiformis]